MLQPDTTALILGGGASGLLLGAACAEAGIAAQIIEPRTRYEADRTWSFWADPQHEFADCELGRWSQWSVAPARPKEALQAEQTITRRSQAMVYASLDSGRVYDRLTGTIDQSQSVTLHRGLSAFGTPERDAAGHWQVATDDGVLTAQYVFDSRPDMTTRPIYGQYFVGQEIRTERPCFDPSVAQLMHFRMDPDGTGIDFLYTLPFAADHALVEVTRFTAIAPEEDSMTAWLDQELDAILGDTLAHCERLEAGFLPMVVQQPARPAQPGLCRIGLAGGAARASTGYAFNRMNQAAKQLAQQLSDGNPQPQVDLDGSLSRWMDRVFLTVIQRYPERAPALFCQLFQRAPADRMERFLEGSKQLGDRFAIMRSLPVAPFLSAALGRSTAHRPHGAHDAHGAGS